MAAGRIGGSGTMPQAPTLSPQASPKGEAADAPTARGAVPLDRTTAPAAAAAAAGAPDMDGDAASIGGKDFGVQLSEGGRHRADAHRKALNIARNTPDIREDKVTDIKKRIADGSYQVDSGKIADGMMHEAIREHLAQEK